MTHDPVCGMEVDPEKARERKEHEGQTYFFCSAGCRKKKSALALEADRARGRMRYHNLWLAWSGTFLLPWAWPYLWNPGHRRVMLRTSFGTALLGLTEPIYVPRYWNPPSLFELAQLTGFDIESLIFAFAIGGIGSGLTSASWPSC